MKIALFRKFKRPNFYRKHDYSYHWKYSIARYQLIGKIENF